jgi:hypothetical protein
LAARASKYILAAIARTVPTEGHSRVKPSVYFRPMAQMISSPAAINSMAQYGFMIASFLWSPAPAR